MIDVNVNAACSRNDDFICFNNAVADSITLFITLLIIDVNVNAKLVSCVTMCKSVYQQIDRYLLCILNIVYGKFLCSY